MNLSNESYNVARNSPYIHINEHTLCMVALIIELPLLKTTPHPPVPLQLSNWEILGHQFRKRTGTC